MKAFCFTRLFAAAVLCAAGFLLFTPPAANASEACKVCNLRNNSGCRLRCEANKDQQAECHASCMESSCGSVCGDELKPPPPPSDLGRTTSVDELRDSDRSQGTDCRRCLDYMEQTECPKRCPGFENRRACIRKCANRECSSKCGLPGALIDRNDASRPRKSCSECERTAKRGCAKRCGDPQRAGYVACEVSCIEERCLEPCNPQAFR